MENYKHYLWGRRFVVQTDNNAIMSMNKLENPAGRVARMLLKIQEYDFIFERISTQENAVADFWSRNESIIASLDIINIPKIDEIKFQQKIDPKLAHLTYKILKTPHKLTVTEQKCFIRDGVIFHKDTIRTALGTQTIHQVVIPERLKPHILADGHKPHFGHIRTYDTIRERYWWQNLYTEVGHYVKTCEKCMQFKQIGRVKPAPLQRNVTSSQCMAVISVDLIGPFRESKLGHRYALTILDNFSKYLQIYPLKGGTAKETAERILDYITVFGIPDKLLTDNSSSFRSELITELGNRLGIKRLFISPYNSQTNGQLERTHQQLKKTISIWCDEDKQWDIYLNLYAFLYNDQIHGTTKMKPSFVMFGHSVNTSLKPLEINTEISFNNVETFMDDKIKKLTEVRKQISENIEKSRIAQEKYQLKHAYLRKFNIGDKVYLQYEDKKRLLPKRIKYTGPFEVVAIHGEVGYTVKNLKEPNKPLKRIHVDRIIKYTERNERFQIPQEATSVKRDYSLELTKQGVTAELSSSEEDDIPLTYFVRKRIMRRVKNHRNRQYQNP